MKAAHQYALMALGILIVFVKDVTSGANAFLIFPIIVPVFILCIIGAVILWKEPESIKYTGER
jgi:hypothetical protein